MGKACIQVSLVLGMALAVMGCNTSTGGDESKTSAVYTYSSSEKVSVDEATLEDLAPYASFCQGQKRCVTICHRPPGNPANGKTKVLPLAAIAAHLNHGGPHVDKDYIGACGASEGGGGGSDGGDDGGSDGGGTGGGGGETPAWCVPYILIDANCDGYVDDNGELLL